MARAHIRALRVSGIEKPDAEIAFGPGLTLITGRSDTGKTHIVECLDFCLGAGKPPKDIPERRGYDQVAIELSRGDSIYVIARRISDPDTATVYSGDLAGWDGEAGDSVKATLQGVPPGTKTLSGWLLELSDFDVDSPIVKNQRGQHQRLSFRTFAPMALVDEEAIISSDSPVLSKQNTEHTANRSIFGILLTGKGPTLEEVEEIREAHERRQGAVERLEVIDPMIDQIRKGTEGLPLTRAEMEAELGRLEQELADISETVSKSGERARALMGERNRALHKAEAANRKALASRDLQGRFQLLSEHYKADVGRLEFVLEGGHFFQQIVASHCPTCGRAIEGDVEPDCHPESAQFSKVEQAARAEIKKLSPRMDDLTEAIADAVAREEREVGVAQAASTQAGRLDREIEEVANPTAEAARGRVREVTTRRRALEEQLLQFRELDRYQAARQEADVIVHQTIERYRPEQNAPSLIALAGQIQALLSKWHFPIQSDLQFDLKTDDIVIDGKKRAAFGKGARAITHAGFTVGLMLHCLAKGTPHPGFVVLDSPLTPYKGKTDEVDDPELTAAVHPALLHSLATIEGRAQTIIIENIDPPEGIHREAVVHEFVGQEEPGRSGFYPATSPS
jgi:hypothetical protein